MKDELLNLIPDDILNLIWEYIKPSEKYCANKTLFTEFYNSRFFLVNKTHKFNNYRYSSVNKNTNIFKINNYNYIHFLIKNDLVIFMHYILDLHIESCFENNINILYHYKMQYNNYKFENLIDFCYYFCNKYKSYGVTNYINYLINKYKLTHLIKKIHKNNNRKNIKWII